MNRAKLVLAFLLAIITVGAAEVSAQNDKDLHSTVQVSLFPPLSTNGNRARLYTNKFSFNFLAGVSKNERSFAFAGLANVILDEADGFQIAGLVNHTGGESNGFQFAGLANTVRGDVNGFQFGGLVNTGRDLEGFQFGGVANIARNLEGFQFGGVANLARDVEGAQFAGVANIAGDVDGLQFGGLFNVARDVEGVQFAGLVNVAEHSDYPIGIINIIREGEMGIGIGYNEIGTTSVNFRSGGRVLYGILGLGYNHRAPGKEAWAVVGGYGAHINILQWFRINNEITAENLGIFSNDSDTFKAGYALLPAFRPVRSVEIFGGPSINYMYSAEESMFGVFPKNSLWKERSTTKKGDPKLQQAFVGWQVGVQFIW